MDRGEGKDGLPTLASAACRFSETHPDAPCRHARWGLGRAKGSIGTESASLQSGVMRRKHKLVMASIQMRRSRRMSLGPELGDLGLVGLSCWISSSYPAAMGPNEVQFTTPRNSPRVFFPLLSNSPHHCSASRLDDPGP